MDIIVRNLNIGDADRDCITAIVDITDDDRDAWIRSAAIEVSIPKDKVMTASLQVTEKILINEAFAFLSQVLSSRSS